jgi:hypothetical protein
MMTEQQTEDSTRDVVVVIWRVKINGTIIVICSFELQAFSKSSYQSKLRV